MAIKVTLRKKLITGNRHSLYLDFYPSIPHPKTGIPTRREFLGIYLDTKPKTALDKQHNKEKEDRAKQILRLRENELNKPEIYSEQEKERVKKMALGEQSFVEYFRKLADKRKASNYDNWVSAYNHLVDFSGGNLKFIEVTVRFCQDFGDYLLNATSKRSSKAQLTRNTAVSYYRKLKAALKQAYKDGFLPTDVNQQIENLKPAETHRQFLTEEELSVLIQAECPMPILKQASMFSILTGLRFSDIEKLVWGEIQYTAQQGYYIYFRQKKTEGVEALPISKQAFELLGERGEPGDKVFVGLDYKKTQRPLKAWLTNAGITKPITFHCFRHTNATLLLSKGIDIYTVSKMLGHREVKTTQVYAKVLDKAKREAAEKIILKL